MKYNNNSHIEIKRVTWPHYAVYEWWLLKLYSCFCTKKVCIIYENKNIQKFIQYISSSSNFIIVIRMVVRQKQNTEMFIISIQLLSSKNVVILKFILFFRNGALNANIHICFLRFVDNGELWHNCFFQFGDSKLMLNGLVFPDFAYEEQI